ncbi:hypothetical protein [Dactylococcopsis salina]|uniref:hypothetical protein n=1 Tax=Dactylococcopsis salina TaxID=292566 RepID=UPI001E343D32|nr:hypothetical protein [Dactylococcopsis salina]
MFKGPYVSLSRSFRQGAAIADLASENILHPHLENIAEYPSLYGHQEKAVRAISQGKTTLISTGGRGKRNVSFILLLAIVCNSKTRTPQKEL